MIPEECIGLLVLQKRRAARDIVQKVAVARA